MVIIKSAACCCIIVFISNRVPLSSCVLQYFCTPYAISTNNHDCPLLFKNVNTSTPGLQVRYFTCWHMWLLTLGEQFYFHFLSHKVLVYPPLVVAYHALPLQHPHREPVASLSGSQIEDWPLSGTLVYNPSTVMERLYRDLGTDIAWNLCKGRGYPLYFLASLTRSPYASPPSPNETLPPP